jgi:hypothetical protein
MAAMPIIISIMGSADSALKISEIMDSRIPMASTTTTIGRARTPRARAIIPSIKIKKINPIIDDMCTPLFHYNFYSIYLDVVFFGIP